ncbi:IrmA family protein [Yersinia kristensenii]|uniref:IrmA family protein n=1 Tax=Yersinia kristensenii TaxID=28152 RepID=UPI00119F62DA|nr:IrmA family protein [Yersinia kristensenii]
MSRFTKALPVIAGLMLCHLSSAYADEQRYISIRNTDTIWTPGNICVYQFRLDNGGSGVGFGQLAVSLRLKDNAGNTLATGTMEVAPFGDSDATRSQEAFLEHECVENVSAVEIMKVTEERSGYKSDLPLSVFDPQYYQPLPISVVGNKPS